MDSPFKLLSEQCQTLFALIGLEKSQYRHLQLNEDGGLTVALWEKPFDGNLGKTIQRTGTVGIGKSTGLAQKIRVYCLILEL